MSKFYLSWIFLLILLAIFAPILAPYNPYEINLSLLNSPPSAMHWLGTDLLGRDLLSRILYALQTSFLVGIGSATLSIVFALLYILLSQSLFHQFFQRVLDLLLAIPSLLLAMFIQSFTSGGNLMMICVIALGHWVFIAKVLDTQLSQLKKLDYYQCSITLGSSKLQALLQDLLPACFNLLIVLFILNIAHGIGTESTLGFFGLNGDATLPSLGNMLNDFSKALFLGAWWVIVFPILAILALILPLLHLGNSIQDKLGVKL